MKRISLHRIGTSARMSAARFPLALLMAAVAGFAAVILLDNDDSVWLLKLMLTAQLGIPLLIAATLTTEEDTWPGATARAAWMARGGAILLLIIYYFSLSTPLGEAELVRHIQVNVAAHLAVAVLPFLRRGENNAFWQYNLALALRLLAALFFSHVLFGGLSVALVALDTLLGVNVDHEVYPQLWASIVFLFNTWYFMAGIPERPRALEDRHTFPAIVRVFAQFILAPLVMVYLAILSAYLVKVIVTTEWPSGQIGYLVSSVAVAGIFSLLLLYPLSVKPQIRWVGIYARIYYILLVPAVAMLLMAIGKRIGQYGVTENRYLLTAMAIWLAGVVLVGVVRGRPFLKVIPLTLGIVAIITAYGPLAATRISRNSQLSRLDTMLAQYDRLEDGHIVSAARPVIRADGQEIGSILVYLFANHGPRALGDRADAELQLALDAEQAKALKNRVLDVQMANIVVEYAGLPEVQASRGTDNEYYRVVREQLPRTTSTEGFGYVIEFQLPRDEGREIGVGPRTLRLSSHAVQSDLSIFKGDSTRLEIGLAARLADLANADVVDHQRQAPDSLMRLELEDADLHLRLLVETINWREEADGTDTISHLQGTLLVKLK